MAGSHPTAHRAAPRSARSASAAPTSTSRCRNTPANTATGCARRPRPGNGPRNCWRGTRPIANRCSRASTRRVRRLADADGIALLRDISREPGRTLAARPRNPDRRCEGPSRPRHLQARDRREVPARRNQACRRPCATRPGRTPGKLALLFPSARLAVHRHTARTRAVLPGVPRIGDVGRRARRRRIRSASRGRDAGRFILPRGAYDDARPPARAS